MTITALRRKNTADESEAFNPDTRRRLNLFVAPTTDTAPSIRDYSDIPPCIAWSRKLTGSQELANKLRAHGFDVRHSGYSVVVWAPTGWTQYIDQGGNVRFLDEFKVLRMIWTNLGPNLPEIEFFTRLEVGYNLHTNRYYLYDRQSGEVLKLHKSRKQMKRWLDRNYPAYADPAAYRGHTLKSAAWWKIWN